MSLSAPSTFSIEAPDPATLGVQPSTSPTEESSRAHGRVPLLAGAGFLAASIPAGIVTTRVMEERYCAPDIPDCMSAPFTGLGVTLGMATFGAALATAGGVAWYNHRPGRRVAVVGDTVVLSVAF